MVTQIIRYYMNHDDNIFHNVDILQPPKCAVIKAECVYYYNDWNSVSTSLYKVYRLKGGKVLYLRQKRMLIGRISK